MNQGLGLRAAHDRTCQWCGAVFTATKDSKVYR
jgi:hypothetical protein